MLIPPKYILTPKISELLAQIEANKEVVNSVSIPKELERNIRKKSTLKSSVFSARIEGNTATLDEYSKLSPKDKKKIEVGNILRAINWIGKGSKNDITLKDIQTLHYLVMKNIEFEELGKFRTKHEGIFGPSGVVIYHAPPPSRIFALTHRLLRFVNGSDEQFVPIRAALSHFTFEKIHPFTDGSGRVGRLLMQMVLANGGYGFKGVLAFEEKIDSKREIYYAMFSEPEKDVKNYLEFILEIIKEASEETKRLFLSKQNVETSVVLLPRREEILAIIKEHKIINFDSIKRRFVKVNERTLRYDLKKLRDGGFIQKLGITRGTYYKVK